MDEESKDCDEPWPCPSMVAVESGDHTQLTSKTSKTSKTGTIRVVKKVTTSSVRMSFVYQHHI